MHANLVSTSIQPRSRRGRPTTARGAWIGLQKTINRCCSGLSGPSRSPHIFAAHAVRSDARKDSATHTSSLASHSAISADVAAGGFGNTGILVTGSFLCLELRHCSGDDAEPNNRQDSLDPRFGQARHVSLSHAMIARRIPFAESMAPNHAGTIIDRLRSNISATMLAMLYDLQLSSPQGAGAPPHLLCTTCFIAVGACGAGGRMPL